MKPDRRSFIKGSVAAAVGAGVAAQRVAHAAGANDKIVVGLIGHGNQGGNHLKVFAHGENIELASVCDPDSGR